MDDKTVGFLNYLAITIFKYMRSEGEKRVIRSAFDKYVSPAIIDTMLKDPSRLKLGGEKRMQLMANVLNLLGSNTATSRFPTETAASRGASVAITEEQFFRGFGLSSGQHGEP